MPANNHEKIIEECLIRMIQTGSNPEESKNITIQDINNFKRAGIIDLHAERGTSGAVTLEVLAGFLTAKYPPTEVRGISDEGEQDDEQEPAGENCPTLIISFKGEVAKNTFPEFEKSWLPRLESINLVPENDDEAAVLKGFCSELKDTEKAVQGVLDDALKENADVSGVIENVRGLLEKLRTTRITGSNAVKKIEDKRKADGIEAAELSVRTYVDTVRANNKAIPKGVPLCNGLGPIKAAAKGKKKIETMSAAVDAAVSLLKGEIDTKAAHCVAMIVLIDECAYPEQFPDRADVCQGEVATVEALISARVATRKLAESDRIEKERLKAEAKKKAEVEVKEKKEKEAAEVKRKATARSGGHGVEPGPSSIDPPRKYTLDELKTEAAEIKNPVYFERWKGKHQPRFNRSLNPVEADIFRKFTEDRLAELRGDPPTPADPPGGKQQAESEEVPAEQEPEPMRFRIMYNALLTPQQAKTLATAVRAVLEGSPFVEQKDIEIARVKIKP